MFQIEIIVWILATLCVIAIPCVRLGHKLFVVSEKIDDTIKQEVDKLALQEQQKYDMIHEKYIQHMQEKQTSLDSDSRFESIEWTVQVDVDAASQIPLSSSDQATATVDSAVSSLTTIVKPTTVENNPSPLRAWSTILDQPQITVSGKTLDDQLKDKKIKAIQQIKQEYKILIDKSDIDAIERKLVTWLALDPTDKDFNTRLADLYFWTQNNKKAMTLLKKNLDSNPDEHKILWQVAEIHIRQIEYQQAQIIIWQAIAKENNNPKYYMTQAEALYQTGDMSWATYAIQQAVKLRPNNKDYLLALADMYERIWEQSQAKQVYYRLFELDPLNVSVKEKIASFKNIA